MKRSSPSSEPGLGQFTTRFGVCTVASIVTVPSTIRIERTEDYYTDYIGRCADGSQFMGLVVATLEGPPDEGWEARKRWYAVLHRFDAKGNHLETKSEFTGTTADGEEEVVARAQAKRTEMVDSLGDVDFCDVEIALFSTSIDGHEFGLFDESDEDGPRAELRPNDFLFTPPWDGSYDT